MGHCFLSDRDKRKLLALMEDTGKAFKPDIVNQTLSIVIFALKVLNLEQFFDRGAVFSKFTLKDWFDRINNPQTRWQIKTLLGVKINPEQDSAFGVANRILRKLLGLQLEEIGSAGGRKHKHRIYRGCNVNPDERTAIFARWFERDSQFREQVA